MKLSMLLLALSATAFPANAADLLFCRNLKPDGSSESARIFETKAGYAIEQKYCAYRNYCGVESAPIHIVTYESGGLIHGSRLFRNEKTSLVHFFGEYVVGGVTFPDENCREKNGNLTIQGRGELGDGLFGACGSGETGYEHIAKQSARADAQRQCGEAEAVMVSEFKMSVECIRDSETRVARALFRCDPVTAP